MQDAKVTSTVGGTSSIFRKALVPAAYCKRPAERNFNRRLLAVTAAAILFGGACTARSGPCTGQIEQIEHQIGSDVAGPTFGLTAPQSVDAQLHHQPTPSSVEQAEHVANTDGDVAINRAIRADAAGDGTRCSQDLGAARRFYNIKQ
jgi:hypothetical protein